MEQPEPRGTTALLITVPEADPLVSGARKKYDPSAGAGVPAHVTVLYPFLPVERIDDAVTAELRALFAAQEPFALDFTGFGRFPDLLWLAPQPDAPLRALTAAVEARWPQAPPYRGEYGDPVPHLTVAGGQPQEVYEALEREIGSALPLRAGVTGVHLVVNDGVRWRLRETFPLAGGIGGADDLRNR